MSIELLPPAEATPDNPRWHELRRQGVTASEIAEILGISPWGSAFSLYWRKAAGWGASTTDAMEAGRRLEPVIADWWADRHPHLAVRPAGLYAHPERPWQLATPDRLVCTESGVVAVLECKWASAWDGWGEPGSDDVPVHYRAQVLWQCDVLDVDEWHIAVLGPGGLRAYTGRRDETDLRIMREHARRFVERLRADEPPPLDDHEATVTTLRRIHPTPVDGEAEISDATARLYQRARALRAHADRLLAAAEARLRAEMGDRAIAAHRGRRIATRTVYTTRRIDTRRLRGEQPDIAAQYETTAITDRLTPARSRHDSDR